ncbi:unnamed protein product, partial [Ceratitis capitata]
MDLRSKDSAEKCTEMAKTQRRHRARHAHCEHRKTREIFAEVKEANHLIEVR